MSRRSLEVADAALLVWLLDSDPALRWQVQRDLVGAPENVWTETRARVATEGFGARLLALQDADGQWAGGAYFPGDFDFDGPEAQEGAGQPWTATTWSLNALREWGLDASVLAGTAELLAENSQWEYDNLPYWGGEVDCCINGYTLANGAWLSADVSGLAAWFIEHAMLDGRVELRVGQRVDALVVPLDAQLAAGPVLVRPVRRQQRRHPRRTAPG